MKHTFLLASLALILSLQTGSADEAALKKLDPATVASARELVKLCEMNTTIEDTYLNALDSEVDHFQRLGVDKESIIEIKNEMVSFFKEVLPWSELEPEFVRFYATKFSEPELKEIITFAKTPTGKKTLSLSTTIMTAGVKAGRQRVRGRLQELEPRIMPIVEKALREKQAKEKAE